MKIKARDIIPGWPRGRSTESWKIHQYKFLDVWWLNIIISKEMKESLKLDVLYHQMQQAMINEWFARYRLGDEVFNNVVKVRIRTGYNNVVRGEIHIPVPILDSEWFELEPDRRTLYTFWFRRNPR